MFRTVVVSSLIRRLEPYVHPRVVAMLFLGFAAGLPLLLVGGTFTAWLADLGVERAAIGFLSWVGIAHSIKVLWSPVVDRLAVPVLTRVLGRRRAWIVVAQLTVGAGLLGMALTDPTASLWLVALLGAVTAFGSATQDIAVDAYRVEAVSRAQQGLAAASYVTGYRIAILVAGGGALQIAEAAGWAVAYAAMAAFMLVGLTVTLISGEPVRAAGDDDPAREPRVRAYLSATRHRARLRAINAWLIAAVICPLADFFGRYGRVALLILVFVGSFRISDLVMGVMANPFYLDLGFSKSQIGVVTQYFGLAMTLTGAFVGGLLVLRVGIGRMLAVTAVMAPITNLTFAWLATLGPEIGGLVVAIVADNMTGGMATAVLLAYMASLTTSGYTATQYALLSSLMTLPGQVIGGFTGWLSDLLDWFWFFVCAAGFGLPAVVLALLLLRLAPPDAPPRDADAG